MEPAKLQKYSFFGGLLEEQIRKILPFMEKKSCPRGSDIILEGSLNDRISFILEGRVALIKQGVAFLEFSEGDTFGEMEVLDIMPSAATVRALEDTTVLSISNKSLRGIYREDIHCFSLIIMNLARELSRRLRYMDDLVTLKQGASPADQ
ncbi:MAG: cyclic nucleotide-binding domain-containing protein [Treponema sp.]|jgi:CRP-like cAMP-binding protein|nr:cyclic nucleotide-binding domain-containing protein [Treponema sp.]